MVKVDPELMDSYLSATRELHRACNMALSDYLYTGPVQTVAEFNESDFRAAIKVMKECADRIYEVCA